MNRSSLQQWFLVLLASATLAGVGFVSYRLVNRSVVDRHQSHKEALRLAEFGLQLELQKINEKQAWGPDTLSGVLEEGSYRVLAEIDPRGLMVVISSGQTGQVTRQIRCVLTRVKTGEATQYAIKEWKEE